MGVPDEVTDPAQRAAWNYPVMGTESGASVMLTVPPGTGSGGDDPWFFETLQAGSTMQGEEYAGYEHYDRGVQFVATYQAGQPTRPTVTGSSAPVPCPMANPPVLAPSFPGYTNYNYTWGTWTGTMQLSQSGAWIFIELLPPAQLPPGQQWNWPVWGGFLYSAPGAVAMWIPAAPGVGYTDPWWFTLKVSAGPVLSGSGYAYTCHTFESTFRASTH